MALCYKRLSKLTHLRFLHLLTKTVVPKHLLGTKNSSTHFKDYQDNLIFPPRDLWSSKRERKKQHYLNNYSQSRKGYMPCKGFCCSLKLARGCRRTPVLQPLLPRLITMKLDTKLLEAKGDNLLPVLVDKAGSSSTPSFPPQSPTSGHKSGDPSLSEYFLTWWMQLVTDAMLVISPSYRLAASMSALTGHSEQDPRITPSNQQGDHCKKPGQGQG